MKPSPFLSFAVAIAFASAQNLALAQPPAPPPPPPPAAEPPAATAQPAPSGPLSETLSGEAKESYEAGKVLYGDGDFAGAVLKFQRAYDLSKDPRLLWNVLASEKNVRHYARVEKLLHVYLSTGGATLTESDRNDAQSLLEAVRPFIAEIALTVNEPGATVSVDDAEVGTTPLAEPLRVDMGPRKVRVAKPGFREFVETQTFGGGAVTTLEVTLVAEVHEGHLRISAPADATLRIDTKIVGKGEWEGKVASGPHAVEVTAPGKETWRADSLVRDDQLTTLLVSLRDVPPSGGVPMWVWITGGTVLAAGLGTGAYFLFKPADKGPPAPTAGTLATWELPFGRH
ncbi:MAG TPA: PEGA domain-containing protein [Polyangiaceae bacterium]|nr:PEGA domain-containing protein [Polyangiaceae bacterium]